MKSGKERREHMKKLFEEQYKENGGSPVPPYDFGNTVNLIAKQKREFSRFVVLEMLMIGITLEEFIRFAQDPYTWYPLGAYPLSDNDLQPETNPQDN